MFKKLLLASNSFFVSKRFLNLLNTFDYEGNKNRIYIISF